MSAGANTLRRGGAREVGDLRLLEDGSKRGGALESDLVFSETASMGGEAGAEAYQWALTENRTLKGAAAHSSSEILVSLRTAASAEAPLSPMLFLLTLRVRGAARMVRKQLCQGALTQKQTLWGRGAPEAFDARLREDFHELEQA